MSENVLIAIIAAGSAIFGNAIGFWSALLIANRTAKIEERKHYRELGVQIAIQLSKDEVEMAQKIADLTQEIRLTPPLSVLVANSLKMMEIVSDTSLTSGEVGSRLAELNKFTESVITEIRAKK